MDTPGTLNRAGGGHGHTLGQWTGLAEVVNTPGTVERTGGGGGHPWDSNRAGGGRVHPWDSVQGWWRP